MASKVGRVLVVDDEQDTRALIQEVLVEEGYDVHLCANGEQALQALGRNHFELVLADVKMPGISGIELLAQVRELAPYTEVIIMTAFASVKTMQEAWRGEACDFLAKPFPLTELRERVDAAMRTQSQRDPTRYEDLRLDLQARRVWIADRAIKLSPLEYKMMTYLFEHRACTVSHFDLLREVWDHADPQEGNLDSVKACITRIRAKLGDDAQNPRYIFNEWGVGYRLGR